MNIQDLETLEVLQLNSDEAVMGGFVDPTFATDFVFGTVDRVNGFVGEFVPSATGFVGAVGGGVPAFVGGGTAAVRGLVEKAGGLAQ